MAINQEITLNISRQSEFAKFFIPQGDNIDRVFYVNLINGDEEYVIPSTASVRFQMTKSNGKVIYNNCPVVDNKIKLEITPAISAEANRHPAQFRITDSTTGGLLKSFRFHIFFEECVDIDSIIVNTSEFKALQDMELRVGDVSNVIVNAETATIDAVAAKDAANTAADLANTKAGLADTASINANTATTNAIAATTNANNARYLGEYVAGTTYKVSNIVKYQNALYICKAETTGNLPSNTTYWDISSKQFTWKSTYNNSTAYTALDAVYYLGSSYICKQASTGNLPINTTYFEPLSLKGDKGAALSPKGTYSSEVTYITDDLVNYNSSVWQCLQTSTGIAPAEGANWTIFLTGGGAIGDLGTLKTDTKTTAVDAINENHDKIGNIITLTTTEKTSLVGAINEHDTEIGDSSQLQTIATNLTDGINEVNSKTLDNPKYKKKVGQRVHISGTDWALQAANWTTINNPTDTFTLSTDRLILKGATGADLMKAMHYYNKFATASKRTIIKATMISKSGTGAGKLGVLFSLYAVNTLGYTPFQWMLCTDSTYSDVTNRIIRYFNYSSAEGKPTTAKLPTINIGDIIEMTCVSDNSAINISYKNVTQNETISMLIRYDSMGAPPNAWYLGIRCLGGDWDITDLEITANELQNSDLIFIGDSISSGCGISRTGRDFPALVASRFPTYSISRFSTGWDELYIYANPVVLQELVAMKPKYVFMLLGINDIGYGRTLEQRKSDYQTIINALKAVGTKIIHGGLLPNDDTDVRDFNEWIRATYSTELIIDVFSCLAADGVSPNRNGSTVYGINPYYTVDGCHPNDMGDLVLADTISMFLIEKGILNPSLMLSDDDTKGNMHLGKGLVGVAGSTTSLTLMGTQLPFSTIYERKVTLALTTMTISDIPYTADTSFSNITITSPVVPANSNGISYIILSGFTGLTVGKVYIIQTDDIIKVGL